MKAFAIGVTGLLLGTVLRPQPASADLRVCNQTSYVLYAAVGYEAGVQMLTRGWTRVVPGNCATLLQGVLNQSTYFLYARSSRAHAGPIRAWGGRIRLCAKETNFVIDVPVGAGHCPSGDSFLVPFASLATGHKASWTTTLNELRSFATAGAAKSAGEARLLADLGYKMDANASAKAIAQALTDFRLRNHVSVRAKEDDVVDALETRALRASAPAGFTVCNDGNAEIWTAIGLRANQAGVARGWWDVPPGACAKLLTRPLTTTSVYLRATKVGNSNLVAGPAMFCTGTASFVLSNTTRCTGAGQHLLGFVETATNNSSGYVVHIGNNGLIPAATKPTAARAARPGLTQGTRP